MRATFYHSPLCPRCARARRHLRELLGQSYDSLVEEIDAGRHPRATWQAGIRMIPALQYGSEVISGIVLGRQTIADFLTRHHLEHSRGDGLA